jgi:F420H(2)-dependent quinone reductase
MPSPTTIPEAPTRTGQSRQPFLPPRVVVRTAWYAHRFYYRITGGKRGLWRPAPGKWGTMQLTTVGRRSGRTRDAILGYIEDGPNLVTMAMNGWSEGEPAWWLNLQAEPDASVTLKDGVRLIHARAAEGAERDRLWAAYAEHWPELDDYAPRRRSTAVVVLEPRDASVSIRS